MQSVLSPTAFTLAHGEDFPVHYICCEETHFACLPKSTPPWMHNNIWFRYEIGEGTIQQQAIKCDLPITAATFPSKTSCAPSCNNTWPRTRSRLWQAAQPPLRVSPTAAWLREAAHGPRMAGLTRPPARTITASGHCRPQADRRRLATATLALKMDWSGPSTPMTGKCPLRPCTFTCRPTTLTEHAQPVGRWMLTHRHGLFLSNIA